MERGLLSSEEFGAFAKDVVLFCHVTSRVPGASHPNLLYERGGAGWPYVCVLDGAGLRVARVDGAKLRGRGVAELRRCLDEDVAGFYALEKAARTGDAAAKAAWFMARFERGHLGIEELGAALGKKSFLGKDERLEVHGRWLELRAQRELRGVDLGKPATFGPVAKRLLAMHRADGLPEGPAGIRPWFVILEDAWLRKDRRTFELAFTALRAAGMSMQPRFMAKRKRQLEELRALEAKAKKKRRAP